jgi:hypothetical protein
MTKTEFLGVRTLPDERRALEALATKRGETLSQALRRLIVEAARQAGWAEVGNAKPN